MPINSPLSHITDVIQQVKSSAQNYKTVLQNNEAATRATLIDPILRALGWDTSDANMVVFELTSGNFRVDYALRDAQSHVKAIVEAKALGGNLDDTSIIGKLFNYAIHFKLSEIWLTDGVVWHHHTNLNLNDLTPTKILDVTHDDPASIAAYFVASLDAAKYWPKEITVGNITQEVENLRQQICEMQKGYEALEQRLAKLEATSSKPVPMQTPIVPQTASPVSIIATPIATSQFRSLSSFASEELGALIPTMVRLPDNSEILVKSWRNVLREFCEYVLKSDPNLSIPLLDADNKTRELITRSPKPNRLGCYSQSIHNNQLYINVECTGASCVKKRHLYSEQNTIHRNRCGNHLQA